MDEQRFYLVTFTDDHQMFFVKSAQLEEPTMAKIFIPYKLGEIEIGVTCYITNKRNWEPALIEMLILKQFFEEKGLPSLGNS